MKPGVRRAGLVGGVLGLAAAGAAAGLAAERYAVGRVRLAPDPYADEPFGHLPADRTRTVRTDDGVRLHVEEVGPEDAPLTVVLVHGYCLDMGTFHFQRKELASLDGPPLRQVLYDQRGHGRSGRGPRENATIDQLGADLERVLDEVVPRGPIVLIGHSMGGMTVMALADRRPQLFHDRVLGAALLSTSSGRLGDVTFGLPSAFAVVRRPVMPLLVRGMQRTPALFERGRRFGSDIAFLLTRRYGFGDKHVSPALVEYVEEMIASTPVEVIAEFMTAFSTHDKLASLAEMTDVETLVLAGTDDLMTPVAHSRTIADALPQAELVEVEDGGHLVLLERAPLVNLHLRAFLHRATRDVARPAPRRFRKA